MYASQMPNAKGRMQQDQSLLLDLIDLVSYLISFPFISFHFLSFPFIIFHLMVCWISLGGSIPYIDVQLDWLARAMAG